MNTFGSWEAPGSICGREQGREMESLGDSALKAEEEEDAGEALRRLRWVHEREGKQSLEESNGES